MHKNTQYVITCLSPVLEPPVTTGKSGGNQSSVNLRASYTTSSLNSCNFTTSTKTFVDVIDPSSNLSYKFQPVAHTTPSCVRIMLWPNPATTEDKF